jgi:hypothetical protein
MSFPCVASRDLARYQAEVDDDAAYDDALEAFERENLFDAIRAIGMDSRLEDLVVEALDNDDSVKARLVEMFKAGWDKK